MNAREMFEELGYLLETYNEYTIKYSKEEYNYTTFDFNLETKKIYSRFMSKAHGITLDELKAVIQQAKELGWLEEEKQEIKQETNFEHYKDEILDNCFDSLAVVKGIPKLCYKTSCNNCDFKLIKKGCHEKVMDWLKQPYKKTTYKLTKFEKELLQCYPYKNSFKLFNSLNGMKKKGYFKGIDDNEIIGDILENCEVV
jgi:hypothetical protein